MKQFNQAVERKRKLPLMLFSFMMTLVTSVTLIQAPKTDALDLQGVFNGVQQFLTGSQPTPTSQSPDTEINVTKPASSLSTTPSTTPTTTPSATASDASTSTPTTTPNSANTALIVDKPVTSDSPALAATQATPTGINGGKNFYNTSPLSTQKKTFLESSARLAAIAGLGLLAAAIVFTLLRYVWQHMPRARTLKTNP